MSSAPHRRLGDIVFLTVGGLLLLFLLIPQRQFEPPPPSRAGRAPSLNIVADPLRIDRFYSGTSMSFDGGRTWEPLKDSRGRTAVLLGGPHALPPAISPDGKLLFGEVLFDENIRPFGHGLIAHAVEWSNDEWKIVAPERPDDRTRPAMRVADIGYQASSARPFVAVDDELLGAVKSQAPGKIAAAVVTATGTPYVAVRETAKFALYWMPSTDQWLPVADARAIVDLDRTADGVVYAAGERFGRSIAGNWTWTMWPAGFSPQRISVHPKQPRLIAAWGQGRLVVSRDGGTTFGEKLLPGIQVAFAAWDPFRRNTMMVINASNRDIYRVTISSWR